MADPGWRWAWVARLSWLSGYENPPVMARIRPVLLSSTITAPCTSGRTRSSARTDDLLRPSLYEAWHEIVPVREPDPAAPREPADVVGPICESTDALALGRGRQVVTVIFGRHKPPLRAKGLLRVARGPGALEITRNRDGSLHVRDANGTHGRLRLDDTALVGLSGPGD